MLRRTLLVAAVVGCLWLPAAAAQPASAGSVSEVTNLTAELTGDVSDLTAGVTAGVTNVTAGVTNATAGETNATENATGAVLDGPTEHVADSNSTGNGTTTPERLSNGSDRTTRRPLTSSLDEVVTGELLADLPLTGNLLDAVASNGTRDEGGLLGEPSGDETTAGVDGESGSASDSGVLSGLLGTDPGVVTVANGSLNRLLTSPLSTLLDVANLDGNAGDREPLRTPEADPGSVGDVDDPASPEKPRAEERDDAGGNETGTDGDRDGTGAPSDSGDDGPSDGSPGSGAGAGVGLVLVVGGLGGSSTPVTGTVTSVPTGGRLLVETLRRGAALHLGESGHRVVPFVSAFRYSRHDDSDPLENDTRASIYDLVGESPGTYYAQLASETGVTEETVRYHARVLEKEGLVECRKLRGRGRLYPVGLDSDDPALGAAIADSAASTVLDAIERREPTTLSTIAEAIDCAPSTVAYHLDRLEEDGLVTRQRDGGAVEVRLRVSTRVKLDRSVADD